MINIRELILDMLMEILEKEGYSHLVIREVLNKYNYIEGRDKAFIKRVTEGTLERLIYIDYVLNQFSKVQTGKMKPLIRNLLRMSVYQLLFMDNVPDSAVCNEAVKLAGKRGFRSLSGYVNGVLRNIARNKEQLKLPDKEKDKVGYLSVVYSMPEWIVSLWLQEQGDARTETMLEALLKEAPVTVRLNDSLTLDEKANWLTALEKAKITACRHPYVSCAYRLQDTEGIANLPGYGEGCFAVQDVSSMLAVEATGIRKLLQENRESSEKITLLDVCSAPGGKSLYAGDILKDKGFVTARDWTEYRVSLIRDNIERMNAVNVEAQVRDALIYDETWKEKADVVLADLPCSGLGIIGKKRDIKYRSSKEKCKELSKLQKQILSVVWQYVKPGGVLLYSTCTVSADENEKVVSWFVQNYPFETESLTPYLPEALQEEGRKGYIQLLPGVHETDGFFIARLRRK